MPDTHVVCGVALKPFCIGHWLHLNRFEVSFVNAEAKEHTLGDLVLSVMVCAESHESFTQGLTSGRIDRVAARWGRRLSGGWTGRLRRWLRQKLTKRIPTPDEIIGFNFFDECDKFARYLSDHGATPLVVNDWSRPTSVALVKSGGKLYAPELMVLLNLLTSELGIPEKEALNMPLPKARWTWAIHAESKGWSRIADPDELDADQQQANEFAAKVFANPDNPEKWN